MKQYTQQDVRGALGKIPKTLLGFVDSKKLSDLYTGIQKKHNFTLAQIVAIAKATNLSLIGLELESALETNIHHLLHELSNEQTRELVADINDRIFKEARRRVEENIIEQNPMTLNAESPPFTEEEKKRQAELARVESLPEGSPELISLREAENKAFEERRRLEREEDQKLIATEPKETEEAAPDPSEVARKMFEWVEKNPGIPIEEAPFFKKPRPTPEEELAAEEKLREENAAPAPSMKLAQSGAITSTEKNLRARTAGEIDGVRPVSIAQSKLQTSSTATPVETVSTKSLSETPAQSARSSTPPIPKRVDGVDPYREMPD